MGCNKRWRITSLGTTSKKEHKYSSHCWTSKRYEKKWGSTHQQRQLTTVCVGVFFTEIFHLLVERTNFILLATFRRGGPCCQLPIMLLDMMTFNALALQMGHELKDTLHDYWSSLMAAHSVSQWDHDMRQIFIHTAFSAFCRKYSMWVCMCINHSQALNSCA
jgi:hypothetical protein